MIVSLISAIATDRVIGKKNTIPWYSPVDLAWFKCHTLNKPIIMGRKTFNSIGKLLKGRWNIILSRHPNDHIQNVTWVTNSEQAIAMVKHVEEVMIIGGGQIYEIFFPQAKRLYLTHINAKVDGDTWFPNFNRNEWYSTFNKFHSADKKNIYSCYFEILERY
ncbi:type 3 dihydrofolate reductase [Candidatus Curculioniphilus buchneri]|uniref:type 3 dihydrofolate reductase n=1 Tax=Candidatus Curculioniphilus buchneri TaxID=690594 RepID=UPI00376EB82E